ncbi:MAG: amino acid ABC transporter substrate-binding protein [Deltaproteobacteria bacterium]|nr:amino acid ABC transporter substrate-binding protein [Deltaproteobacteria bacterium]
MLHYIRSIVILAALSCIVLLLHGCEREPIRIGFVGGMSGRVADLGVGGRNGALLAIEERNAAGGINGRPIELIIRDDEQNSETARKVTRELIGQRVEAIIGPMTSSMALAIVPTINTARLVTVSPTVTTSELSGLDDYFLRVLPDTRTYSPKSARFHFDKSGLRRAALIYDTGNSSYTVSWLTGFRNTFEKLGGRIVAVNSFQSAENVAFSPLVRDLLRHRPDLVVLVCNAVDAALLCQQIRKLEPRVTISVSEWGSTERFIELGGAAVEGIFFAQFLDHGNTSPHYLRFLTAYRKRFGQDPGFSGLAGYDAATVVLEALAQRNNGTPLKSAILATGAYQGVQKKIILDRFGDVASTTFITVVKNGRFVTLE